MPGTIPMTLQVPLSVFLRFEKEQNDEPFATYIQRLALKGWGVEDNQGGAEHSWFTLQNLPVRVELFKLRGEFVLLGAFQDICNAFNVATSYRTTLARKFYSIHPDYMQEFSFVMSVDPDHPDAKRGGFVGRTQKAVNLSLLRKFWAEGNLAALPTTMYNKYFLLQEMMKLMVPHLPFKQRERIYQGLEK